MRHRVFSRSRPARVVTLVTALMLSRAAEATVRLSPSADGYLGAWLLFGPAREEDAALLTDADAPAWQRLRLVHGVEAALALSRVLPVRPRDRTRALLAGVLELPERAELWVLVGATGRQTTYVDGTAISTRRDITRVLAWDHARVALDAGTHVLSFLLENDGDPFQFACRLLDAETLLPPEGALLRLPGTTASDSERLESALLSAGVTAELTAQGALARVDVSYPRGVPASAARRVTLGMKRRGADETTTRLGHLPATERGVFPLRAAVPVPVSDGDTTNGKWSATLTVGSVQRRFELLVDEEHIGLIARADAALGKLDRSARPVSGDAAIQRAALEYLRHAVAQATGSPPDAAAALSSLLGALEGGVDPVHRAGVITLAERSRLDGALHPFAVHVPEGYERGAARTYPLVVLLHGYRGTPESVLAAFMDRRGRASHPGIDGFVLAPEAFGDAFYRGPGERSVIELLDWALRTYPIDPDRVSITGVSMGGTGAAHLGFRYADRFAAVAPLAGYHSYFVRRDTSGRPLSEWEKARMHHWSPASFADNARHQFVFVAHGTKDFPLDNSRVLTDRLRSLQYDLVDQWPEIGHSVWDIVYDRGAFFPKLAARSRPTSPRHVTLRTDQLRYGQSYWVRVTSLDPGELAFVDAKVVADGQVTVRAEHVRGLELVRPIPGDSPDRRLAVTVNNVPLEFEPGARATLALQEGSPPARRAPAASPAPGVEGAIRDVYLEPLAFVFGTGDARTTRANREVAEYFANLQTGSARYPVVPDIGVTDALTATHSLFVVGVEHASAVVRSFLGRLPFRAEGGGIVGEAGPRYAGNELGALFVQPSTTSPARAAAVLTAVDAAGVWRALSLPRLLPDYVVYDGRVRAATGEQVLGAAVVPDAGFFTAPFPTSGPP